MVHGDDALPSRKRSRESSTQLVTPPLRNECHPLVVRSLMDEDPLADPNYLASVLDAYRNLVSHARQRVALHGAESTIKDTQGSACDVAQGSSPPLLASASSSSSMSSYLLRKLADRLPPTTAQLNARYKRLVKIGEGAFGDVYICWDTATSQYVTVKRMKHLLHNNRSKDAGLHVTILREIQALWMARHENVVPLIDFHLMEDGLCMLIMPVVSHDLSGLVRLWRRPSVESGDLPKRNGSLLPLSYVKCIVKQLLEALKYLHSWGIWHRDMKMSNILLHHNGTVVLIDFGWSRFEPVELELQRREANASLRSAERNAASAQVSESSYAKSTPHASIFPSAALVLLSGPPCTVNYRPPEVLIGAPSQFQYSGASLDMWGVGCIVYELVTGEMLVPGRLGDLDALRRVIEVIGAPSPKSSLYFGAGRGAHERIAVIKERVKATDTVLKATIARAVDEDPHGTDTAYHFIAALLQWEPRHRLTARKALEHPWLTTAAPLPCERGDMILPQTNTYHYLMAPPRDVER